MKYVSLEFVEMIDNQLYCKFGDKRIKGGGAGIHKMNNTWLVLEEKLSHV